MPTHTLTQWIASSLFLLEVIGVCIFHVLHDQWRPLLTSAYLWYLLILAVGGMVAAGFYDPLQAHNGIKVLVPLVQVCVCLSVIFPHPSFPHPCFPPLINISSASLLSFSSSSILSIFFFFPPPSPLPNLSFTVSSSSSPPPSLPGSKEILP